MAKFFNLDSKKINLMIDQIKSKNDLDKSESKIESEKFDLHYDRTEENEEEYEDDFSVKVEDTKAKNTKSLSSHLFKMMKNKMKVFGKFMAGGNNENKEKYLTIPKTDEDNNYSSQALSQFWIIFKFLFQKSQKIIKVSDMKL